MTAKAKNPRRQAGQYRAMVKQHRRMCYLVSLFWLLPLIGIPICFRFHAHSFVKFVVICAFVSGIIGQVTEILRLRDWKERLQGLEAQDG